jgi:eukaryotic-like serine/threonine-protein kinase
VRERFRREAQTLASMRSQHTIALYDYGTTDDGTFFYVMELLDGIDLDMMLRDHGPQPAARVIKLLIQACQSLAEAHEAGLLHRDIKPANLFVCRVADEVDVLKVLDFGIVHAMNEGKPLEIVTLPLPPKPGVEPEARPSAPRLTAVGSLVGTPGYIAPEQAFGEAIDARADLYALGCVAWWLLAGNEVFPRADDEAAIRSHAQEPVPDLRARMRGWLPVGLESLVLACLAKHPNKRPRDARAMIAALRAIAIPDEHAWDDDRAAAWWREHRPAPPTAVSTDSLPRTIVPQLAVRDASATSVEKLSAHRDKA